jgi:hypothetical protein
MLKVLLRPFAYLSIKHSDPICLWVNWIVPISFALLTALLWLAPTILDYFNFVNPISPDIWSGSGLVSKIQGFVQNLPGFYIAALAAVATFGGKSMQKAMPGKAPTMRFLFEGQMTSSQPLSRRLFLCSMFAYLTMLSFLLTVGAVFGITFAPVIKSLLVPWSSLLINAVATSVYILFFVQMLTITGWGVYYVGERMHMSDGHES